MLFEKIYYETCYLAHRNVYSSDELARMQCERIGDRFQMLFDRMVFQRMTSAHIHEENLKRQTKYWGWLRSNKTCLTCLRRGPEHVLLCGHSVCDICVRVYGKISISTEEEYTLS